MKRLRSISHYGDVQFSDNEGSRFTSHFAAKTTKLFDYEDKRITPNAKNVDR